MSNRPSAEYPRSHVAEPPDQTFWKDTLFFGRFDEVMRRASQPGGVAGMLAELFGSGAGRSVADGVVARAGGGHDAQVNVALVGTFTEYKDTDAVEATALSALDPAEVEVNRTPGGRVRRHAIMVLLFEKDPRLLLTVALWDRHRSRRRTRYRLKPALESRPGLLPDECRMAAGRALDAMRRRGAQGFSGYDDFQVFACDSADEMLVALREWPGRSTGRTDTGDVLTIRLPDWTVLHLAEGGDRIEVTDRLVHDDHGLPFLAGEGCPPPHR